MATKEDVKQLTQLLIKLGGGEQIQVTMSRNLVMDVIHSEDFSDSLSELEEQDIVTLLKGLCLFEKLPDMQFGSTTQIPKILKIFEHELQRLQDLIDWLFVNRDNPYIPYGGHIPLQVKSLLEYHDYEKRREEHRQKMREEDQKKHQEAELVKEEKRKFHENITNSKREIFAKIDKEVEDLLKDRTKDNGYDDSFQLMKQRILKEKYGINWKITKTKSVIYSPYY
ncbi:MAG: hypothetical protein KBC41_03650 [Candidatus Pacebacteria bacterium]|nr:hypothetical protein [Candidatus Paceibacterota bacterium]